MFKLYIKYLNKTSYPIIKLSVAIFSLILCLILAKTTELEDIFNLTKIIPILFNFSFFFSLYTSRIYDFDKFFETKRKRLSFTYFLIFQKEILEISMYYFLSIYICFSRLYYIPLELFLCILISEQAFFSIASLIYILLENTMYIFIIPLLNFIAWMLNDLIKQEFMSYIMLSYDYSNYNLRINSNMLVITLEMIISYFLFLLIFNKKSRR